MESECTRDTDFDITEYELQDSELLQLILANAEIKKYALENSKMVLKKKRKTPG